MLGARLIISFIDACPLCKMQDQVHCLYANIPSLAFFTPVSSLIDEILMGQFLHSVSLLLVFWQPFQATGMSTLTTM
jgi:hypothetical protein